MNLIQEVASGFVLYKKEKSIKHMEVLHKMKIPLKRHVLVTHDDLDGAGCAIVFSRYCHLKGLNYEVITVSIDEVDSTIKGIIDDEDSLVSLYIADIAPKNEDIVRRLDELYVRNTGIHIALLDHHEKTAERFESYSGISKFYWFSTSECGTAMLYKYLGAKKPFDDLSRFVAMVNDYDNYIRKISDSMTMNILFRHIGIRRFIDRGLEMTDPALFTRDEIICTEAIQQQNNVYISKKIESYETTEYDGLKLAIVFADHSQNEIADEMRKSKDRLGLDNSYNGVAIVDMTSKRVSLRTLDDETDLGSVAAALDINGGGHKKSAGFSVSKTANEDLIWHLFSSENYDDTKSEQN